MLRQLAIGSAFAVLAAGSAWAGEYGTPAEAKAMLQKAVAAVNADKAKALEMFTKGEGGFKDRDLYPYCGGPDGNFTAHPSLVGKSLKDLKDKAKAAGGELSAKDKKELTEEEKEYKSKRKLVQEKLIKFATRIPAFMYLTDFRENTLQDVITKLEPDLFHAVTGLTVPDFHLLVRLKVFNTERMNEAVFAFRRYEDASLRYTGIESHKGLTHYGLYDTVVAKE